MFKEIGAEDLYYLNGGATYPIPGGNNSSNFFKENLFWDVLHEAGKQTTKVIYFAAGVVVGAAKEIANTAKAFGFK